jgi:hypothetical protein
MIAQATPAQTTAFDPLLYLCIFYGLVVVGTVTVLGILLKKVNPSHGYTLRAIFAETRFLELTTVLVIIFSGTFLAWFAKLNDGIVALLSGIAGYVLGGLAKSKPKPEPPETTPPKPAETKTP